MRRGKDTLYNTCTKRVLGLTLSLLAIIILSPLIVFLAIIGAFVMKGNPFFVQRRPGKIDSKTNEEKIIKIVKFRTMSNEKDSSGVLLPDNKRLNKYGIWLRKSSLDEIPELFSVLFGDLSLIGPRPLLIEYLPYYSEYERQRHLVRPGITGYAQVNGRNCVSWDKRLQYDVEYVENVSFALDLKIFFRTISIIFRRSGVAIDTAETEGNFAQIRKSLEKRSAGI